MKTAALGELCDITVGRTPARAQPELWGRGSPWLSIADMNQGPLIRSTKEQITETAAASGRLIPSGTVLLSFKLSIGKVGITTIPLYTNEAIAALPIRDRSRLDEQYLAHALRAMDLTTGSNRAAMGATLNKKNLTTIQLPVPPLDDQRRIAAILDQADAIRTRRCQALTHLDTLTQSIFHSYQEADAARQKQLVMGDIVTHIDSGRSPKCEARPARAEEWGVLKLGAVTYGTFRPDENKAYLERVGSMASNEVRPGDVLMTRKNTLELVGAVALVHDVRPKLLLPDLIFRLHLDAQQVDPYFFHALMMSPATRAAVRGLAGGSAASMSNISKSRLLSLPISLPPLASQQQFAARIARVRTHHIPVERALAVDNELFTSLQSRAFRGEL